MSQHPRSNDLPVECGQAWKTNTMYAQPFEDRHDPSEGNDQMFDAFDPLLARMDCLDQLPVDARVTWIRTTRETLARKLDENIDIHGRYAELTRQAARDVIVVKIACLDRMLEAVHGGFEPEPGS